MKRWSELRAQRSGRCALCDADIVEGSTIFYDAAWRAVRCEDCRALTGPTGARLGQVHWAVIDVETTGLAVDGGDRVIELAVVRLDGQGREIGSFSALIDPGRDPGPTHVHGIDTAMLDGAPEFSQVADGFARLCDNAVLVAHNAGFDTRFVSNEWDRAGLGIPDAPVVCTLEMARELVPGLSNHKLATLADHFNVDPGAAHRALDDARTCGQVLVRLLSMGWQRGWRTVGDAGGEGPVLPSGFNVEPVGT